MRFSFFLFSFAIAMILVSCQMAEAPESFPTSQNDITPIPSSNDGSQQTNSSYLSSRKLIRTGEVECETQDTGPLSDQIIQSAVNHEGFVSAQSSKYINERQVKDFSIQVPSSQFDMFMSEVQAILPEKAKVNIQSQDVTDQLVDLEARLQSKILLEERYLALIEKGTEIKELTFMEQSLNDVRLQIERIQASIASMEGKVAFSKIDFSIRQPIVIQVAEAPGFLS